MVITMNGQPDFESEVLAQELDERLQKKVKMRALKIWLFGIAVVLILLTGLVFLLMKIFFSVKEVALTGEVDCSVEEVFEASGIKKGDLLLFIDKSKATARIKEKFVMIEEVTIERELPDKIVFRVKNETPYFYFENESPDASSESLTYVVVSKSQKVLEMFTSVEEMVQKYGSLPCVRMPALLFAGQHRPLIFANDGDSDFIPQLISLVRNSVFDDEVMFIDAHIRFDIIVYSGIANDGLPKYELQLGNKKRLEEKIALADNIAKNRLDPAFAGIINVATSGDEEVKGGFARAR